MSMPDTPPTPTQIRDQLKRMLASQRFRNAQNPSDFLALVVGRALEGKQTPGRIIAAELFGEKFESGVTNDVRVTASNLRKTLERYYEREGSDNLVIISLAETPKDKTIRPVEGEAYSPRFSFNPTYETEVALRVGYHHLDRRTYSDFISAFIIFSDLMERFPGHTGAPLALAETLCWFADRDWKPPMEGEWYPNAMDLLDSVQARAQDYWRVWAVRGFTHTSLGLLYEARPAFDRALELNRAQTEVYPPYINFLLRAGHVDEAICLAAEYMKSRLEDDAAHVLFGQFLLHACRPDDAIKIWEEAVKYNPGNCAAHEFLAFMGLLRGDRARVIKELQILKMLSDETNYKLTIEMLERIEKQLGVTGFMEKALTADTISASGAKISIG